MACVRYGNNCGCKERRAYVPSWGPGNINHYKGDVQATIDFGFDGIKLDGCVGGLKGGLIVGYFAPL